MTEDQFWQVADIWYQRTLRLKSICDDRSIGIEKRAKAMKLFFTMLKRVYIISQMAFEISTPKKPNFPLGGFVVAKVNHNEDHTPKNSASTGDNS